MMYEPPSHAQYWWTQQIHQQQIHAHQIHQQQIHQQIHQQQLHQIHQQQIHQLHQENPEEQEEDEEGDEEGNDQQKQRSKKLPINGNPETMNLQEILLVNVQSSEYFKSLYELKTYHEVLDEIYNEVDHLEPYMSGITPSPAFCLLYKLFRMRLTYKQMKGMLDHKDSPYIRTIGFLYLRLTLPPKDLWDWFFPYFEDTEELYLAAGEKRKMTVGRFVQRLLTEQKHFSLLLPRIPVPVMRDIREKMKEIQPEEEKRGNDWETRGGSPGRDRWNKDIDRGSPSRDKRQSRDMDNRRRPDDHDRDWDRDRRRSRSRERPRSRDRDKRRNEGDRRHSRDRDSRRSRDRRHSRDSRRRSRDGDRERERDRERRRSREGDKRHSRERDRRRSRDGDRERRTTSYRDSRDSRRSHSPHNRKRHRSRERSRSPRPTTGQQPKKPRVNMQLLRDMYGSSSDEVTDNKPSINPNLGTAETIRLGFKNNK